MRQSKSSGQHILMAMANRFRTTLRRSLVSLDRSSWLDLGAVARSRYLLAKVLQEQKSTNPSRLLEAKRLEDLANNCRKEFIPRPGEIFEAQNVDPMPYFDLMVPFTARTRFGHDKVKQRSLAE